MLTGRLRWRVAPAICIGPIVALVVSRPLAAQSASASQAGGWVKEFGTMWTFDAPPLAYWKARYGFTPDQAWLDHVRLASVRIPGCSASFVSANGLVMTNHHCGRDCTAGVSPQRHQLHRDRVRGRSSPTRRSARDCTSISSVDRRRYAPRSERRHRRRRRPSRSSSARRRSPPIREECSAQTDDVCEVVTALSGRHVLALPYKRLHDVRLVMAPEGEIAFYGGDPDNFTFPRYDLDLTLLPCLRERQAAAAEATT